MTDLIPFAPSLPVAASDALARHARAARGALADNTVRALRADSAVFTTWCAGAGVSPLPATSETVAAFVDAMAGKAVATVRRYVASIAHMHRAAELPDPTKAEVVKLAVRRKARATGTRQRQAKGITQVLANTLMDAMGDSVKDRRDRALMLVGRDLLARRGELVALNVGDIVQNDDGTAVVTIRRSKTDQEGAGAVRLLGPGATAALRAWLAVRGDVEPGSPLFVTLPRSGRRMRLDDGDVSRILKGIARRAKVAYEGHISGHSLRVGMAQDLTAHGCDLPSLMQAGRWSTATMPSRYTEALEARRGAVARFYGLR